MRRFFPEQLVADARWI